jgi:hypothetical protein
MSNERGAHYHSGLRQKSILVREKKVFFFPSQFLHQKVRVDRQNKKRKTVQWMMNYFQEKKIASYYLGILRYQDGKKLNNRLYIYFTAFSNWIEGLKRRIDPSQLNDSNFSSFFAAYKK